MDFEAVSFRHDIAEQPSSCKDQTVTRSTRNKGMVTGCLACRAVNRVCGTGYEYCRPQNMSSAWRMNHPLVAGVSAEHWREREGLHLFLTRFISAPERAGVFRSEFWHRTVPEACLQFECLTTLGAAIGMLSQSLYGAHGKQMPIEHADFRMALGLCNRGVGSLMASPVKNDPEIALIACILLIYFSSMQGEAGTALRYTIQASSLYDVAILAISSGGGHALLRFPSIQVFIDGLKIQAMCVIDRSLIPAEWVRKGVKRPLPLFTKISDLDQAHGLLHSALNILWSAAPDLDETLPYSELSKVIRARHNLYLPWLHSWQYEFNDMCRSKLSELCVGSKEWQKVQILQANYTIAVVFARLDLTRGYDAWEPFSCEFGAIVSLGSTILSMQDSPLYIGGISGRFPLFMHSLSMLTPLFFTMARCPSHVLRKRAGHLLLRIMKKEPESGDIPRGGLGLDQWLDRLAGMSLDKAAAAFFGAYENQLTTLDGPSWNSRHSR